MPIEVELPDGNVVEFPDGTDNATMERALKEYAKPKADFSNVRSAPATTKPDLAKTRIGRGTAGNMHPVRAAATSFLSPVAETIVGVGQMMGADEDWVRESTQRIDAVRDRAPVSGVAGEIAALAFPASKIGKLTKAKQYASSAALGAGYGGTRAVRDDESRVGNTAWGAGFGLAGQAASNAVLASGKKAADAVAPEMRALYEAAKQRGITLTPTQLSDSRFLRYLESQMRALPLSGAAGRAAEQISAWNKELVKALGMKGDRLTPAVYAAAKQRDKAGFESLTARNNLSVTDDLLSRLEQIKSEATLAGDNAAKATSNAVDAFYARVRSAGGKDMVPGRAYQSLDSQMGNVAKLGNEASHYVGQVRDAIRQAMDDSISPNDRAAWQQLRQWYGARKTLTDLVAKANGGDISPASLMARVTANKAGKEAMASGTRGELGTLARIGQTMKEPSSSGTAERILAGGLLNPVNWPAASVGVATGAASRLIPRRAVSRAMVSPRRGKGRQAVAPLARAIAPAAAPQSRKSKDSGDRP